MNTKITIGLGINKSGHSIASTALSYAVLPKYLAIIDRLNSQFHF